LSGGTDTGKDCSMLLRCRRERTKAFQDKYTIALRKKGEKLGVSTTEEIR